MSAPQFDVAVVGGGSNGLVAAARLARRGRRVLLLESQEALGGMRRIVEPAPGFKAAPLAIDPGWAPAWICDELGIRQPSPIVEDAPLSVVGAAGEALTLSRDPAQAAAALTRHSAADAGRWVDFTARLQRLAGFLAVLYCQDPPDVDVSSLAEAVPLLKLASAFRGLGPDGMIEFLRTLPMSVWELLDDTFESPLLKAAVAAGGVHALRQGPKSGGTGFVLLHDLVGASSGSARGRAPWRGGPGAFVDAAEAVARRAGVTIRLGATVARITVRDEQVSGIVLDDGEEIAVPRAISTAGPAKTMLEWVDPVWLDPELIHALGNIRHRGAMSTVVYALDALPQVRGLAAEALAGVVSLTPDLVTLERAADAAKYGEVSERLHVELTVPTLGWPEAAPAGKHVLVATATYTPYRLASGEWTDPARVALAARVTTAIDEAAPGFSSSIRSVVAWSPRDLESKLGLLEGATTQGELALDQILFMRPVPGWGRHATPIRGLYLGGCGTHPGPGILGGAGWLAAGRLLADARRSS